NRMRIGRKLGFIGAGNMAEALIRGLLSTGAAEPSDIIASARRDERKAELAKLYGIRVGDNLAVTRESDVVVLAVKPQIMDRVLRERGPSTDGGKLVVSVAAGVPIEAIERRLHSPSRIIRAMPNTPALVGAGATALAAGEHATTDDLDVAERLFKSVGTTVV